MCNLTRADAKRAAMNRSRWRTVVDALCPTKWTAGLGQVGQISHWAAFGPGERNQKLCQHNTRGKSFRMTFMNSFDFITKKM